MGRANLEQNQTSEALAHFESSLAIDRQSATSNPQSADAQNDLSISYSKMADIYLRLGETEEALRNYQQSLEIHQRLADNDPKNALTQRHLLVNFFKFGSLEQGRQEYSAAVIWYQRALDVARRFDRPDVFANETEIVQSQLDACRLAEQVLADESLAFAQEPAQVTPLVLIRLNVLLKQQEVPAAIATAERFAAWAEEHAENKNDHRYNAACFFARCAAAAEETERDALVDKVVAVLQNAQTDGYFGEKQLAHFQQDTDFNGIRDHEAFATFSKELMPVADTAPPSPPGPSDAPTDDKPTPDGP